MSSEQRVSQLETTVNDLLAAIERLPHEVLYRAPGPNEWSIMSTLAHLQELLPYWAHQAEAIQRSPGAPFGRQHDDPARIGAIAQHGSDTLDTMVPRVRASLAECAATLGALPASAWGLTGVHPGRGVMTIEQVVDAFLVHHAAEHASQIERTLA